MKPVLLLAFSIALVRTVSADDTNTVITPANAVAPGSTVIPCVGTPPIDGIK